MKKRIPGFCIIIISCLANVNAQQVFSHSLNEFTYPYVSDVMIADNEKRFLITSGTTNVPYETEYSSIMIKCDSAGNIEWQHYQVEYDSNQFKNIALDGMVQLDTTYLVAGNSKILGQNTAFLLQYSRSGILLDHHGWQVDHYDPTAFIPKMIILTNDNHVVLGGNGGSGSDKTMMILRCTPDGGDPRLFTLSLTWNAYSIKLLSAMDGKGDVIFGCYSYWVTPTAPVIFRIDSSGNYIWQKKIDFTYKTALNDIIQLSDTGYLLIGNGSNKSFVLKTNKNLEVEWTRGIEFPNPNGFGPFPLLNAVQEQADHHLLIAGSQHNGPLSYALLIETDSLGNLLQALLDSSNKTISKIEALPHGNTLLVGQDQFNRLSFFSVDSAFNGVCGLAPAILNWYEEGDPEVIDKNYSPFEQSLIPFTDDSFYYYNPNFALVDVCSEITSVGSEMSDSQFQFSISPIPCGGTVTLNVTVPLSSMCMVKLLDLTGRELYSEIIGTVSGTFSKQLDLSNYSSGIYLLQVMHDGQSEVKKLVIEK